MKPINPRSLFAGFPSRCAGGGPKPGNSPLKQIALRPFHVPRPDSSNKKAKSLHKIAPRRSLDWKQGRATAVQTNHSWKPSRRLPTISRLAFFLSIEARRAPLVHSRNHNPAPKKQEQKTKTTEKSADAARARVDRVASRVASLGAWPGPSTGLAHRMPQQTSASARLSNIPRSHPQGLSTSTAILAPTL